MAADPAGTLYVGVNLGQGPTGLPVSAELVQVFPDGGPGWSAALPDTLPTNDGQLLVRDPHGYLYVAASSSVVKVSP